MNVIYGDFYGLDRAPFSLLPDPAFLYLGHRHETALTLLHYGLESHAAVVLISGEIGSGKTVLVRYLLNQLGEEHNVGLVNQAEPGTANLLPWVLAAFGLAPESDPARAHRLLVDSLVEAYAKGRESLLIVDEAQNLAPVALEQLRLLTNINADEHQLLNMLLVGQPELRQTLSRADMVQLAQRVSVNHHLGTLSPGETDKYVRHRLVVAGREQVLFDALATRVVHHLTGGVPRLINIVCDIALIYGYARRAEMIDCEVLQEIMRDGSAGGLHLTGGDAPGETHGNYAASHRLALAELNEHARADMVVTGGAG